MRWIGRYDRFALIGAAALIGVLLLLLPFALNFGAPDFFSQNTVVAASNDRVEIQSPVVLAQAPFVRLTNGFVVQKNAAPNSRTLNLVLDRATVVVGPRPAGRLPTIARAGSAPEEMAVAPAVQSPLILALERGDYEGLELKGCTVKIALAGAKLDTLTDVDATVMVRRKAVVSLKGTGRVRGQKISFETTLGGTISDREPDKPTILPLKVNIKADEITSGEFEGKLEVGEALTFKGTGGVSVANGRELARRFGAHWLAGTGLRNVKATGNVSIEKQTILFEKAKFAMDGFSATGALALRFAQPRPILTGTLAAKEIDLTGYFLGQDAEKTRGTNGFNWAALSSGYISVPFGMQLDVDLRISSNGLKVGSLVMGEAAAAIALKDGRLLADIAETKLLGGSGGGQITADFTGFAPKITVRGKLDAVEMETLSKLFSDKAFLKGGVTVVADLASEGFSLRDLLDGIGGKINLMGNSSGRFAIGLLDLIASGTRQGSIGWGRSLESSTDFERLNLKFVVRKGVVLTDTVDVTSGGKSWSATGLVNLPARRLNMRLIRGSGTAGNRQTVKDKTLPETDILELRGPWENPVIRSLTELDLASHSTTVTTP